MVYKFDEYIFMSDFKSHWMLHLQGLVPHLSEKLCKLLNMLWI